MSAHAGGMCMSQCVHWRILLFCFLLPRAENKMQANPLQRAKNPASPFGPAGFLYCKGFQFCPKAPVGLSSTSSKTGRYFYPFFLSPTTVGESIYTDPSVNCW